MTKRTPSGHTSTPQSQITMEAAAPEIYRVCVASHLAADGYVARELVTLTTGYNPTSLPTTTLVLKVENRTQLLNVLQDLHAARLAILSLELLRDPEQIH